MVYLGLGLLLVITILFAVFYTEIINWLQLAPVEITHSLTCCLLNHVLIFSGVTTDDSSDKREKLINFIVLGATVVVSIVALRYINNTTDVGKPDIVYERWKARQAYRSSNVDASYGAPTPAALEAGAGVAAAPLRYTTNIPLAPHVPRSSHQYDREDALDVRPFVALSFLTRKPLVWPSVLYVTLRGATSYLICFVRIMRSCFVLLYS